MMVTHLTFKLGPRHQGRHTVDHQHIDGAGAHQRISDFQRLLTGIRLRDQQFFNINAELLGITRIKRMFRINESTGAAGFLRLRHRVQGKRCLTRAFRPINFDHPAFRQTADTKGNIQTERARRYCFNIERILLAKFHDGAFAKITFNLA